MNNVGCPVCKMPIDSDKSMNANRMKQLQTQEQKTEYAKESVKFNVPKNTEYNKINTYKQVIKFREMLVKCINC
jgi:hypothetical protein